MSYHDYDLEKIIAHIKSTPKKKFILDTDTDAEIDDQFAITYAMLLEDIDILALTAAPYSYEGSDPPEVCMRESYRELVHVRDLVDPDGKMNIPCYLGSENYLDSITSPVISEAAENIVRIVNEADDIVYIGVIGCPTNVASALLLDPSIVDKAVIVLLGGHSFNYDYCGDFNFCQDTNAVRVIFESEVPVIFLPAVGCTDSICMSNSEVYFYLKDKAGKIGNYLCDLFDHEECPPENSDGCQSRLRSIYDLGTVAFLHDPGKFVYQKVPARTVTSTCHWKTLNDAKNIIYVEAAHRNPIISEFLNTLRKADLK